MAVSFFKIDQENSSSFLPHSSSPSLPFLILYNFWFFKWENNMKMWEILPRYIPSKGKDYIALPLKFNLPIMPLMILMQKF